MKRMIFVHFDSTLKTYFMHLKKENLQPNNKDTALTTAKQQHLKQP
jgi:hypothetical protein